MSDKLEQPRADQEVAEIATAKESVESEPSQLVAERESLGQQLVTTEAEGRSAQAEIAAVKGVADIGDDTIEQMADISIETDQKVAVIEGLKSELAATDADIAIVDERADISLPSAESGMADIAIADERADISLPSAESGMADIAIADERADISLPSSEGGVADIAIPSAPEASKEGEVSSEVVQTKAGETIDRARQVLLRGGDRKAAGVKLREIAGQVLEGSLALSDKEQIALESTITLASSTDRSMQKVLLALRKKK
jgi:hypothetical protein